MDFKWIYDLNASRRSINLPVYLVIDLEVGQFNFRVKIVEQSNICMEQSVFDYGVDWLLTIVPTYISTVAFFVTKFVIGFHALQSGFFLWNQGR